MSSIKFDSTELVNTTYVPRFVKHESSPERENILLPITRQNGSVRVSSRYATKTITLQGILTGTSQANLEANIDAFKELFSRVDKNLDIDWNGATRRYVATCVKHEFDRDHFHLLFVPWTAEFVVPAGIGKDTSETTLYDTSALTAVTTTINPLTFAGSAQPKPIITIDLTTVGSAQVVEILNNDTGEYMKIDGPFTNADQLIIDCLNLTVKKNGVAVAFRGIFPNFYIGANSFSLVIIGSGSTLDQSQLVDNGSRNTNYSYGGGQPWTAQSFVPSESGYIDKIQITADKDGSPGGYMNFLIFSDDNNKPGVALSANGYQLNCSAVTSKTQYDAVWVSGTKPFLTAGKKYWIVFNPTQMSGTDASNFCGWYFGESLSYYANGKSMATKDPSSVAYVNGYANAGVGPNYVTPGDYENTFATYMGSGGAASHSVRLRVKYTKLWL